MIRSKIKIWVLFKVALVLICFSSVILFSSIGSASASSLNVSNVAIANAPGIDCSVNFNPLTWLICPIISGLQGIVDSIDNYITTELTIPPCTYFSAKSAPDTFSKCPTPNAGNDQSSDGFYSAWGNLRDLALGLLVIGALVMVISQIMGFEFLDAYTVKKVLPRLLIAAIGISLSWELIQFFIQFSNDLGNGVSYLIYTPFRSITQNGVVIGGDISSAGSVLGFAAIASTGIIGSLTFVLLAVVAVLLGFAIIVLRQILIIFLAILAPVAMALFILPSTDKAWKLWWTTFSKALIMFPLIAGMIAVGRVFAAISSQSGGNVGQFIAFIAYFGPYFLIPQTFKFAGGILATAGSYAGRAEHGLNKTMAGFRKARRQTIHERRMEGSSRVGTGATGNLYRRVATGSLSPTAKGRADFKALNQKILDNASKKHLEEEGGRASGDDLATGLALQKGMTGAKFVEEYMRAAHLEGSEGKAQAIAALSTTEKNFGARIGSDSMRVAAYKAKTGAATGYSPDSAGLQQMYADAGSMVREGLMTTSTAASAIKANKARADQSAVGFQQVISTIQNASTSGSGPNLDEVRSLRQAAFENADPAEIVRGHKNTVLALAPVMAEELQTAMNSNMPDVDKKRKLAKIANIWDTLSQTSSSKSTVIGKDVLGAPIVGIDGAPTTIQSEINRLRTDPEFQTIRREYGQGDPNDPRRAGMPPPEEPA
ncbi:MAG TPA: hypothetical protein VMR76_03125 [Candidatus Saccharimonadia bacterium]|nr:hypothetical protein [Candidatus Saccharimonadia bacterium]